MSGSTRKCFSESTLQISKLVKRVVDLEKDPIDRVRIREQNLEKRQRKKEKIQDENKKKHAQGAQVPFKNVVFKPSNREVVRHISRIGQGCPGRHHSVGGRHNGIGGSRSTTMGSGR